MSIKKSLNLLLFHALILAAVFLLVGTSFGAEKEEEKRQQYLSDQPRQITPQQKKLPFDIRFLLGLSQGYDDNASIDSQRKKDTFTEPSLNVDFTYPVEDLFKIKTQYNFAGVFYHDYTDASLLDHQLKPGAQFKINEDLNCGVFYNFEALRYPDNKDVDYNANGVSAEAEYILSKSIRSRVEYAYIFKDYTARKSLDGAGNTTGDDREDRRHRISGELRFYFEKSMLKLKGGYIRNDSNMDFQDYYDYQGFNGQISYTQIITDKLYCTLSLNYLRTNYFSREVTTRNKKQKDDFYSPRASVFYNLTKDLTWLVRYSYNEADSNDPDQEYSGFTVASGLYYSF